LQAKVGFGAFHGLDFDSVSEIALLSCSWLFTRHCRCSFWKRRE